MMIDSDDQRAEYIALIPFLEVVLLQEDCQDLRIDIVEPVELLQVCILCRLSGSVSELSRPSQEHRHFK